jgi:DNA-binding IscR family transcriptional regulator
VLEIVEAIEGPINGDLLLRNTSAGTEEARVRLEKSCQQVADFAKSVLAKMTIADIAQSNGG